MNCTFIYGLSDPRTGEIRYLGKADDPKRRFDHHVSAAMRPNSPSYHIYSANWIRSLAAVKLKPNLVILEWVPEEEWGHWEQWWLDFFTGIGCRLVNTAEGGRGGVGYLNKGKKRSPEICARISTARKGKKFGPRGPFSEEAREAIRQGLLRAGVKPPPHAYEKALAVNKGRIAWNRGKKMSPETCAKLSAMRIGNQNTLGRKAPPETLERQRQAQIRRWEKWRIDNGVPLDEKERNASRQRQYYAKHKNDPDFMEHNRRYAREAYARRKARA